VLGVTLSAEQIRGAQARAQTRGLSDRVEFRFQDYREVEGLFDRIVSIGMFEHVGRANYDAFFSACAERLDRDGVMLLHTHRLDAAAGPDQSLDHQIHLPGRPSALPVGDRRLGRAGGPDRHRPWKSWAGCITPRPWRLRAAFMGRRDEALALLGERFLPDVGVLSVSRTRPPSATRRSWSSRCSWRNGSRRFP